MKILTDIQTSSKTPSFGKDADVISVDSTDLHVLPYDLDDSGVRAEYLYSVCVDNDVHFAVVQDSCVANKLNDLGIDTAHAI